MQGQRRFLIDNLSSLLNLQVRRSTVAVPRKGCPPVVALLGRTTVVWASSTLELAVALRRRRSTQRVVAVVVGCRSSRSLAHPDQLGRRTWEREHLAKSLLVVVVAHHTFLVGLVHTAARRCTAANETVAAAVPVVAVASAAILGASVADYHP